MDLSRIIFERGIEVGSSQNSVKLTRADLSLEELYAEVWKRYGVRPILLTETVSSHASPTEERHFVLSQNRRKLLDLEISSLALPQGISEPKYISLLRPLVNVQYTSGAVTYHCQQLALLYSLICNKGWHVRQIKEIEGDSFTFQLGSAVDAYYEVEAAYNICKKNI